MRQFILFFGILVCLVMISGCTQETTPAKSVVTPVPSVVPAYTPIPTPSLSGIPKDGIYIFVDAYGWSGEYGTPAKMQKVERSLDQKLIKVENASDIFQATFEKSSSDTTERTLLVKIYNGGTLLTSGETDTHTSKITFSIDTTTGVVKDFKVS